MEPERLSTNWFDFCLACQYGFSLYTPACPALVLFFFVFFFVFFPPPSFSFPSLPIKNCFFCLVFLFLFCFWHVLRSALLFLH